MTVLVETVVDIGTTRSANDDRCLVDQRIYSDDWHRDRKKLPALVTVCDGVGGYAGGGKAAELVCEVLSSYHPEELLNPATIHRAISLANGHIRRVQRENPNYSAMSTTVAGVVFGQERTLVFSVGDSRVYRYDGRRLVQLTVDHSFVQEQQNLLLLTEEEAMRHPSRNKIRRAIGFRDEEEGDVTCQESSIRQGEIYLLCSDGLSDVMTKDSIKEILAMDASLEEKATLLVDYAKYHGSTDNITVCLCSVDPDNRL